MKKLLITFLSFVAFASCSSDDSAAPVTPVQNINVTGTWKEISYQATPNDNWVQYNCGDINTAAVIHTFRADGTFTASQYCENSINDFPDINGAYLIHGDVLTANANDNVITYKISKEGENILYMQRFVTVNGETTYHVKNQLQKQ